VSNGLAVARRRLQSFSDDRLTKHGHSPTPPLADRKGRGFARRGLLERNLVAVVEVEFP
jgi:hypothetical protein